MDYKELINSRFSEPAAILSFHDDMLRIVCINDRFLPEHWMNVPVDHFLNFAIRNSLDEDNLEILTDAVKQCILTGEEQTCETWRYMTSDCCGTDRICLESRLILLENGPDGSVIYEGIRNITNEKRTQATLADIEYRYRSSLEQINIYNWEYTIATKEMRPCYRCMRDLGLPAVVKNYPEPAIDMGIFPPDYADMYREIMRKIDEGAKELEVDIPLTVGRIPFRIKYTTEFDENGVPVKAFGSATLISETELGAIKLDNKIIASLAEEYSAIYLADFIKGNLKEVKKSDMFTLGRDPEYLDLAAQIILKLSGLPDEHVKLLGDTDVIRTSLFKDCEKREFTCRDDLSGEWIRIAYHVIDRSEDTVTRLLITTSVLDDLSARKMDDDLLIASQKAELEDRQKMLVAAIEEANRANEAKTVFFSNMSHDIRTPMNAITGFSKLAAESLDDREKLSGYLEKIITAGDHLLNLINDILDMSRIESGKMELSCSPVVIGELIGDCVEMIRGKILDKGLHLIVDTSELGEDTVSCDKLKFRQILLNLLSNAYKFTPEGGSIFVNARLRERSDRLHYEIRVKDTGIGMSKEFSEHIWEAFTREKTNTVNETQGTGLGMAIVRNIVNMMHGAIELKTELGKGSEFIIELPLEKADPESKGSDVSVSGGKDALSRRYDGITILVTDDSVTNLVLAECVLEKYGFRVLKAESGTHAIEILKSSKSGDISLILMDVLMPVMDGLETTRRIRALSDPAQNTIPIIAMTANAFASDIQEALDAGMNAHVPKPFDEKDLITKIAENL